jgi:WD40 repeat protein
MASGDQDGFIKVWSIDAATAAASLVTFLQAHAHEINAMANLKKGHLASASSDFTIKIWNYDSLKEYGIALLATLTAHSHYVTCLILFANGYLTSGSWDQTVKTWNVAAIYSYPNRSNLIPYQ